MATIKSYTDLNQSRKLAEILPIESADMYYEEVCNLAKAIVGSYILHNQCMEDKDYKKLSNPVLSPAWSLAALFNYLREIDFFPNIEVNEHSITMNVSYYDEKEARPLAPIHNIKVEADTFVNACYELLLKLNEVNLL